MNEAKHTPGPWFVGAQNDALYIIDRRPAHSNDYPDHEADVGCIAKVYDDIRDAEIGRANAALIARAPDLAAEVERLRAELERERRKVEVLRKMVQESAALFRRYEKLHRDKGTDDGLRKAEANAEIAARCDAALAASDPQRGSEAQG